MYRNKSNRVNNNIYLSINFIEELELINPKKKVIVRGEQIEGRRDRSKTVEREPVKFDTHGIF